MRKTPYAEAIAHMKHDIIPILFSITDITELKSSWDVFWMNYKKTEMDYHKLTALAAVDIAIWDLYTKCLNVSLHCYLGGAKDKVPVYGTTGWLSLSLERLLEECRSYQAQGVHAFKVRIGHADDYLRVSSLRAEMGEDYILMLDANSRYSAKEAEKIAIDFEPFNILWLEEPTDSSFDAMYQIKVGSKILIALGENIILFDTFKRICIDRLTDYLQLDLPRCGGVSGFVRVAMLAKDYNIAFCSHLMPQLSVSLVAAFPNGTWVEYNNLLPPHIFISDFSIDNGSIAPPYTIGHGVELSIDTLKVYTTDYQEVTKAV